MSKYTCTGKVSDICPNCKNCKGMSWGVYDEKSDGLIEVECEDPYDGMTKTLDADSNVCCSMFEIRTEKEPFNLNMPREARESIAKLNDIICELEKEKAAHLKGIERLKKSQEKLQNQVKNLHEVADSWQRDYERLRDQFVHPIYNILYPDKPVLNTSFDINVTDLLNDVKNLKVYGDENGRMYKEIQEWREKCVSRGNDIDHLLSENKEKDKKIGELESHKEECEKKYRDEISKLQNIVTEKHTEIKELKKEIINLSFDRVTVKDIMKKNIKFKETISDQEVTIKALLITIKEMCKEDETDE